MVIPPPKNAVIRPQSARDPTVRDRHIAQIRSNGRMAWQAATGYNQRSRIETQIGRWKGVIGPKLKSRSFSRQITEIKVGQKVLNTNDRTRTACVRTHRLTLPLGKGRIPSPPVSCINVLIGPATMEISGKTTNTRGVAMKPFGILVTFAKLRKEGSIAMLRLVVGVVLLSLTAMNTVAQEGATGVLVFVEGSTVSSFSGSGGTSGGNMGGTTEPQTIEVMKQLRRFCPNLRITADRAAADFLILHERQAGGTFGGNRNNIAVFGKDDLLVYADGATQLDNSVEDLCESGLLTGQAG